MTRSRPTPLLLVTCLAGALLVCSAEDAPLRILSPADHVVLESGRLAVLAIGPAVPPDVPRGAAPAVAPALRIDGQQRRWDPYETPALLSRVELPPGVHEVTVGDQTLRLCVRGEGELPEEARDWPVYRTHLGRPESAAECAVCHETETTEGRVAIGAPKEPQACLKCHSAEEFEVTHFHPLQPIAACHLCHALHGSSNPSLLRAPTKALCSKCHE